MSKLEKQKEKARSLEAKDPKGAIEAWRQILKGQEEDADPNPDLAVFNRIGDLYLKVRDPAQAADFYDQAVDKYAELGFHNNAIAMCNKVLRNAPGRQNTYLKLAKLYASKGFMAEAKQNFVDYAERMHKIGKIQQAFAALKELADISPEGAHLRETLEEHLRMYGDPERRPVGTAAPAKAPPAEDPSKSGKRKTSSLVFLDVDAPPVGKGPVQGRVPLPPKPAPAPPPEPEPALEPEAGARPESGPAGGAAGAEAAGCWGHGPIRRRGKPKGARANQGETGRAETPGSAPAQEPGGSAAARTRAGLRHRGDRPGARGRRSTAGDRRRAGGGARHLHRLARRKTPVGGDRLESGRGGESGGR